MTTPVPSGVRDDVVHLILAGLGNSSPGHWQRAWARLLPNTVWLSHDSWDHPDEQAWLADLENFLGGDSRPVVVITHSLGSSLLASWADRHHDDLTKDSPVRAAFIVAPPDTTRPDFPDEVTGFRDISYRRLPFPATVLYSTSDPYSSSQRARETGMALGARLVNVGPAGHINSESGLGDWPAGQQALQELLSRADLGPAGTAAPA